VDGGLSTTSTTTPSEVVMLNGLDRFQPVMDLSDTREHGEDDAAIANWTWPARGHA